MGQSVQHSNEDLMQSQYLDDVVFHLPQLDGNDLRIGIAMSRFNLPVVTGLRESCLKELSEQGVSLEDIELVTVPGALEIPLALLELAKTQRFHALIALGAVIRGETYHFELVSNESCSGVSRISLAHQIPIANAILTTENNEQAVVRMQEKGKDAARVAIEMANLQKGIRQ